VVATGEDAAEAEDDDQEEGSAQGEAEGRSRCVHAGWREILALHYAHLFPSGPGIIEEGAKIYKNMERKEKKNECT